MRDARRRRHEASGPGPEDIIPDLKLGLAGEHVERVDVVVVSVRINSLEVGAKAELDDLELWKLPENPVMSLPAHELLPALRAERDDAVHGHVASLSDSDRSFASDVSFEGEAVGAELSRSPADEAGARGV